MNRFWIFPVLLGFVGVFLPLLVVGEGFLPVAIAYVDIYWSTILGNLDDFSWLWDQIVAIMRATARYGALAGGILGLAFAVFDWWRNGRRDRMGIYATAALLPNLWWCGVYAAALTVFNGLIFCLIARLFPSVSHSDLIWIVPVGLAALLNLVAVLWAGIRCVTSEDVISPRVLRDKLKFLSV